MVLKGMVRLYKANIKFFQKSNIELITILVMVFALISLRRDVKMSLE